MARMRISMCIGISPSLISEWVIVCWMWGFDKKLDVLLVYISSYSLNRL